MVPNRAGRPSLAAFLVAIRRTSSLILRLAVLASSLSCVRSSPEEGKAQILGVEPVQGIVQCQGSSDAFLELAKRGRRETRILHLSSRGNLAGMPRKGISELRDLTAAGRWEDIRRRANGEDHGFLTDDNYLFAAARIGPVKEIIWVLPSRVLEYSDAERRVQALLASGALGPFSADAASFRFKQGCLAGSAADVPVTICTMETLPPLAGRVILDLDAGFFQPYAVERGMNVLAGLKTFIEQAATRKIAVSGVFLRSTLREGTLSPLYAHVAGQAAEVLGDPALVQAAPPETWRLRDLASAMLDEGSAGDALSLLADSRKTYPGDRPLEMMNGMAAALAGSTAQGSDLLSGLCRDDRASCFALVHVGRELQARGKTDDALRSLDAALRADPEFIPALTALAEIRARQKDAEGELACYRRILAREETAEVRLRAGDSLVLLKRPDDAGREYRRALALLAERTESRPPGGALQGSLRRARELFQQQGDRRALESLRPFLPET